MAEKKEYITSENTYEKINHIKNPKTEHHPQPTILIVEDHQAIRTSLREWLQTAFPGAIIWEAASAEKAIHLVAASAPDTVLMDIGLPEMDEIEASRVIKEQSPWIIAIVLTVYDDELHTAAANEAGADHFLSKRKIHSNLLPLMRNLVSNSQVLEKRR